VSGTLDAELVSSLALIEHACPEGWCTTEKAELLAASVLEQKAQTCVEIGVFGGRSLAALGLALKHQGFGLAFGVDPWSPGAALEGECETANTQWWADLDYAAIHESCAAGLTRLELWRHVRLLAIESGVAAQGFEFESVDVLHIDGNHSELGSTRDVHQWLPRVRAGGVVWFDDADWASTTNAQTRIRAQCDLEAHFGNYAMFRKR
jgi:predicted O-methyltransferase YrrM